jgi:hypothetical protein
MAIDVSDASGSAETYQVVRGTLERSECVTKPAGHTNI